MMRNTGQGLFDDRTEGRNGTYLVVSCEVATCDHTVRMEPHSLFGARRFWPVSGRSERFRCRCGSRETLLSYCAESVGCEPHGSKGVIHLWT